MTGAEEAEAFDKKEYLKLHISTLRKVDIIDSIINRTETDSLKVVSTKLQIYGLTLPGIFAIVKETPWLLLIASILGYIIGAALEPIVQKLFHTAT